MCVIVHALAERLYTVHLVFSQLWLGLLVSSDAAEYLFVHGVTVYLLHNVVSTE